eukprot:CAMPEP_0202961522 /NCGR_PEP_ID=MMETSP1396-20130829/5578_1 /ASSEMBLY_ACC=CAM_ASM_000872 /TAXON_ID= /ORGANISM="Pseudokeronopsis sp., Strain Brazil" /LENGTH=140 /DNA_ID=CAMNT_0049681393 /DNA_START=281 /DNA_END=703 /DNA_ORIENTATION=+
MTLVFSVIFFLYGGLILKGRNYAYDYVDKECSNPLGFFSDYDRLHLIAQQFACTEVCPCNADVSLWPDDVAAKMVVDSEKGISVIGECEAYVAYVEGEGISIDSTLKVVEDFFDCSGICYKFDFYFYSDIAKGYPVKNCT